MEILQINNAQFTNFIEDVQKIISNLSEKAKQERHCRVGKTYCKFPVKDRGLFPGRKKA